MWIILVRDQNNFKGRKIDRTPQPVSNDRAVSFPCPEKIDQRSF